MSNINSKGQEKKSISKLKVYGRVFLCMFSVYLVLMSGFSFFYFNNLKDEKIALYTSYFEFYSDAGDALVDYLNGDKAGIEEIAYATNDLLLDSNDYKCTAAVYTSNGEPLFDYRDKWICGYQVEFTDEDDGLTYMTTQYGYFDPYKYFTDDEIKEICDKLNYENEEADWREISGYSIEIRGLWVSGLEIIPESIYILPYYVANTDENGHCIGSVSGDVEDIYTANLYGVHTNGMTRLNIGYLENSEVIVDSSSEIDVSRARLSDLIYDKELFLKIKEEVLNNDSFSGLYYLQPSGLLKFDFISNLPYENFYDEETEYWTICAGEIDLLDAGGKNLLIIIIGCFAVFLAAAWILAHQTYKTNLAQYEMEMSRRNMTNAVAHDLKTPLVTISGYADILVEDIHSEKREYYAGQIQQGVKRMDYMIKQMLELSRLESVDVRVVKESFDLAELTRDVLKNYELLFEEKNCKVEVAVSKDENSNVESENYNSETDNIEENLQVNILADCSMIECAAANLISNAVNNVIEGGSIVVSIGNGRWSVKNTGEPIPEEELGKIWDAYYRTDKARSNPKSTGLGLYMVKTIMELHGFKYGLQNDVDGVLVWFEYEAGESE